MSIWGFQRILSERLIQWALTSIGIGAVLSLGTKFWRGIGSQFIGWGVINMAIAWFGGTMANRRLETLPDPFAPDVMKREAVNLQRLLWINAGLDVLYMRGGEALSRRGGRFQRGMGWGIIIQGAALFIFDVIHAMRTPVDRP